LGSVGSDKFNKGLLSKIKEEDKYIMKSYKLKSQDRYRGKETIFNSEIAAMAYA
jgi:hypothetical protein